MLRKVLVIVGMLLTAPLFILGVKFLSLWARLRLGDGYSVRFDYGSEAVLWLIWGGLTVLFLLGALARKRGGAILLLVGWGSLLLFAIALPSHQIDPVDHARLTSELEVLHLQGAMDAWGKAHGHFPASQAELEEVFQQAQEQWGKAAAPFVQGRQVLSYRALYLAVAQGPVRTLPPGAAPGTILCAVNPELNHYWLTLTGLARPVGGPVVMELDWEYPEAGAAVREGSLAPPAARPAEKRP